MSQSAREEVWAALMRAAIAGDAGAYRRFLEEVTPSLRAIARRHCERYGAPGSDVEDVVQDALLAIHLKRGTWDAMRPIGPWMSTILRNKLIDGLRRRGQQAQVPLDDVVETLEAAPTPDGLERRDVDRLIARLKPPQSEIVRSISVEGASVRETAGRLSMTEGAVRVALHRALKSLAAFYRSDVK